MNAVLFWINAKLKQWLQLEMTAHEVIVVMKIRDMAKLALNFHITSYARSTEPCESSDFIIFALMSKFNINEFNMKRLVKFIWIYLIDNGYMADEMPTAKGIDFEQGT
jgi:hypothetical protein